MIRLQKANGFVRGCKGSNWETALHNLVEAHTDYGEGEKNLPNIYVIFGKRIVDLSGLADNAQVMSLAKVELAKVVPEDSLILLCSDRLD